MEKKKETKKVYAGFASKNKQQLFDLFQTTQKGLSSEQVENLRETYGNNSISYGKKTPFIVEVIKAFITPFTLVLIAL